MTVTAQHCYKKEMTREEEGERPAAWVDQQQTWRRRGEKGPRPEGRAERAESRPPISEGLSLPAPLRVSRRGDAASHQRTPRTTCVGSEWSRGAGVREETGLSHGCKASPEPGQTEQSTEAGGGAAAVGLEMIRLR